MMAKQTNSSAEESLGQWIDDAQLYVRATLLAEGSMALDRTNTLLACAVVLALTWAVTSIIASAQNPKSPLVGWKFYEPRFIANLRFFLTPKAILDEGYAKVESLRTSSVESIADGSSFPIVRFGSLATMPI